MELRRLDPDHGGASVVVLSEDEETFLGRNPVAQITDTLISRKQASVYFDKNSQSWKLKTMVASKLCYYKKFSSEDWVSVPAEIELTTGDQISLTKDKYIYECLFKAEILPAKNDFKSPTNYKVESEKPKSSSPSTDRSLEESKTCTPAKASTPAITFSTPAKEKRVLPDWMLDVDEDNSDEKVQSKNKKDTKTPTKQVPNYRTNCFSSIYINS